MQTRGEYRFRPDYSSLEDWRVTINTYSPKYNVLILGYLSLSFILSSQIFPTHIAMPLSLMIFAQSRQRRSFAIFPHLLHMEVVS